MDGYRETLMYNQHGLRRAEYPGLPSLPWRRCRCMQTTSVSAKRLSRSLACRADGEHGRARARPAHCLFACVAPVWHGIFRRSPLQTGAPANRQASIVEVRKTNKELNPNIVSYINLQHADGGGCCLQ